MSEYGEPWRVTHYTGDEPMTLEELTITDANGNVPLHIEGQLSRRPNLELATRITACFNACSGISTQDLVSGKARVLRTAADWLKHAPPSKTGMALSFIASANDKERREVFTEIRAHYCQGCGCNDPSCQCQNDE